MIRRRPIDAALLFAAAACVQAMPAGAACPQAEILTPERGARVTQPRPVIEWRALPGVSRYRVQLESRIPEGLVLGRTDSVVEGTRFVPPTDLTDSRAAVKLLITAACEGDPAVVTEQAAWFFIDMAPACPPIAMLSFAGPGKVEWTRPVAAGHFEITFYSFPEGKVVASGETTATSYPLLRDSAAMLVAVRPRCRAAIGPAAYGFLPGPR